MFKLNRYHNTNNTGGNTSMDSLSYYYSSIDGKRSNRLNYIDDANTYSFGTDPGDIKNGQAVDNYQYDASGNLTKDVQENINNIVWTADGKVDKICKDGCPKPDTIYFYYDARGDRIAKIEVEYLDVSVPYWYAMVHKTYYVRDANGEILAIYSKKLGRECHIINGCVDCGVPATHSSTNDDAAEIPLSEWLVYGLKGHGRFATVKPTHETFNILTINPPGTSFKRTMKFKEYELKDHLGDVRTTFNDLKYLVNGEFYLNNVETFNYYPFGMLEPTTSSYDGYRFGYNGMERDDEVKDKRTPPYGNRSGSGKGNSYDYGARFYDPRAARFLSLDLMKEEIPSFSPFSFGYNNPILYEDKDGNFPIIPWLLKAGANAASDFLAQATMNYLFDPNVKTWGAAFEKVNWWQVGRSGLEGLIPWKTPCGRIGKATFTAIGDVLANAAYNPSSYTAEQAGLDFATGFIGDLAGSGFGELLSKYGAKNVANGLVNKLGWTAKKVHSLTGVWHSKTDGNFVGQLATRLGNVVEDIDVKYNFSGKRGDVDIVTSEFNIEVKSGKAMKLEQSKKNLEYAKSQGKNYILFMPNATYNQIRDAKNNYGVEVITSEKTLKETIEGKK